MTKVAPVAFDWASAFASSGRSERLPRLDLDILGEQLPPAPVEVVFDGFSLRLDPETGLALFLGRNPQIADEFAARHRVPEPRFVRRGDLS